MAKPDNTQINNVVQTQTNSGSAGGTINYINEGGIKRAWGITAAYSVPGNSTATGIVTLPSSFFSSITGAQITIGELVTDARQTGYISAAPTTTSLALEVQGLTGTTPALGGKWYWEVIGT